MADQIAGFAFRNAPFLFGGLIAAAIFGIVMLVRGRRFRVLRWIGVFALFVLGLISAGGLYAATTIHQTISDRVNRLSFTTMRDGKARTVRDYRGKVVLLNFWATWCGPCRGEMSDLNRLSDMSDIAVLTLTDEDEATIRKYEAKILPLRTVVGTFHDQHPQGGLRAMAYSGRPTTVVLDRNGNVSESLIAAQSYETFAKAIERAR